MDSLFGCDNVDDPSVVELGDIPESVVELSLDKGAPVMLDNSPEVMGL